MATNRDTVNGDYVAEGESVVDPPEDGTAGQYSLYMQDPTETTQLFDTTMDVDANGDVREETLKGLVISRHVYTQQALDAKYPIVERPVPTVQARLRKQCTCSKRPAWKMLTSYLPVVKFVKNYKVREYLLGDLLSGLTVSFMHLPQAMGFGVLASLRPVYGLYTTFWPVLIYLFFGTSPHISIGTNAVMALLTQTVTEQEAERFVNSFPNSTAGGPSEQEILDVKVGAAMTCSFFAGVFLTGMGLLKLGFITTYLSVSFVGGFTTAAAIHIASSQVPKMFGIKVASFAGAGKLVRMYVDMFSKIEDTNFAELIIAVICIAILLLVRECINDRFKDKMKMPVPTDLVIAILGTLISHFAKFKDNFDVTIVGSLPSGIPTPYVPDLGSVTNFLSNAIVMAILSLAMSISMAKLTAKKHGIQIDDNQEMVAYGASNMLSSFFHCFPSATAPPRTMILSSLGSRTTLNAIPTALFILLVILFIGPLFVSLPLSVLAAMIIVSMKDLLLQYRNLPKIWRTNKYDFVIWLVTNLVSVFVDLDYGIMAGVGVSVLLVVVQSQLTSGYLLGVSRSEDLLLSVKTRGESVPPSGVKIFKFPTSLYFATAERFKSQLYSQVLHPQKYRKKLSMMLEMKKLNGDKSRDGNIYQVHVPEPVEQTLKLIIIDCQSMSYIDMGGLNMLLQIIKEYKQVDIAVYLAGVQMAALGVMENDEMFFKTFPKTNLFLEVFDAMEATKAIYSDSEKM